MARYGIDFYGSAVYGAPSFVDFDATPLQVLPFGPGQNMVSWSIPGGEWVRVRLVRNAYGWPVHEDDGRVLVDSNSGPAAVAPLDAPVNSYIDIDLQTGRLYYYSVFVLAFDETNQHNEWRRAADATGISVGGFNYTERMLDLLPEAYWADPNDSSGRNDQLVRFLSVFGFQLDILRTQYETLRELYNPDKVAAALLAPLGDMFGVDFEPEMGAKQHRAMVRNSVFIAKRKGTLAGTNALVSSFTGWDADIQLGVNLMLDYDDSSMEETAGRWYSDTAGVTRRPADGAIAAWQSSTFTNLQAGMLMLTSRVGGSHSTFGPSHMNAHLGGYHPVTAGIPVTAGKTYTFSAYVKAVTTGRNVSLAIRWCDVYGKQISSLQGTQIVDNTSTWVRPSMTAVAPAGAAFAVVFIDLWGLPTTGGESHVADAFQFELGPVATEFQEARDIRISLTAERINELPNPSAELDLFGWSAAGAALVRDTTVAHTGLTSTAPTNTIGSPNVASFRLTSTGSASGSATTPTGTIGIPVDPDTDYAFSAYCFGGVNVALSMTWYDISGAVIETDTGQVWNWINGGWIRPECQATSPENAAFLSVAVIPQFFAADQVLYFDQVLVERGAEVRPYFDGSQFGSRPADYIWEGTPHQSRTHLYFNRTAKTFRLDALLLDYLFPCTTHTLLVAQGFKRKPQAPTEDAIGGSVLLLADSTLTSP